MSATRYQGGCHLSREQELLLRAALLPGQEAIQAWEEWRSLVNIDEIDPGSRRLLPLLYHNLNAQGIDHPLVKLLKGVRRYTWYKNQTVFAHMAVVLRAFREAGIKTMVLKGAALALLYYDDYGLRPMQDLDILVPPLQAPLAIKVLQQLNWTPRGISTEALATNYRSFHGHPFDDASGNVLDLHWQVFWTCLDADADGDFWSAAVATRMRDVPTRALNPADQLLHVCAHGAWWSAVPPLRWVADAMVILNTVAEIDWNRLLVQAQKHHLILPARDTLSYLSEKFQAPVPSTVLEALKSLPVSRAERLEYKALTCPQELRGPILELWLQYLKYARSMPETSVLLRLLGFPKFLQRAWLVDHMWQMPFLIASRGLGRVFKIAGSYRNQSTAQSSHK